ncbi:MAG: wax ester/triacylglycerol synthase family O-acyltransferase [Marmoricola sp.]|nr:wax ester/triacylglycerol synthase family O-acyltransferase [Marmoricola sp.]
MSRKVLKVNDSAWLYAESHRTPMQVAMLATFAVPEDRPDFVRDLVARWRDVREYQPPFNYLLKTTPVPSWKELRPTEIDLDYHFRHSALPSPGSQRELGVLVSRLHSAKMDRRYPLWECHIIEGITEPGRPGAQWSMYMKVHHSQIDGVGGIRLLKRIMSIDHDARDMLPPWAVGTRGPDQSGIPRKVQPPVVPEQREAISVRSLASGPAAVLGSLGKTYTESLLGSSDTDRAVPFKAPKTLFNGRIHTPRRFATQHYSIDRMRAIATASGGSLNDVFLAICGGAMRTYLADAGELPKEPLIANVPVSVREAEGAGVGNAITFLYSSLGTDVSDPIDRMRAIQASTRLGKERLPQVDGLAMDAYTAVLMGPFLSQAILGFGGRGRPASNVVISNVPGPHEPRYIDGSRLLEIYPVSLLFNGQALNITAVSYDGEFNIGFTGCRDSIPSLQKIAVNAGEELDLLERAYGLA